MPSHTQKSHDNQSRVAVQPSRRKRGSEAAFQIVDNRPEAKQLAKLQLMADNSPQAKRQQAIQEMADNSPYGVAHRMRLDALVGGPIQRQGPEEEDLQMKAQAAPFQRQDIEDDELLQEKFSASETPTQLQGEDGHRENNTGLPDNLKARIENLSGVALDNVKVHYNSAKPAQLQALAYTQGQNIHVGPGQEKHLPHEAWHVVQQHQGRVKPILQAEGVAINDDAGLEHEADVMGTNAAATGSIKTSPGHENTGIVTNDQPIQRFASYPTARKPPSISIDEEETGGGHTVERHVITRDQAVTRVVNENQIPSSRWESKSDATNAVENIVKGNWSQIKTWANTQGAGQLDLSNTNTSGKVMWEDLVERDSVEAQLYLYRNKPGAANAQVDVRVVTCYPQQLAKPDDVGPAKKGNVPRTKIWTKS